MENNNTNNNVILHAILVILLLIIAGLGFYIYGNVNNKIETKNDINVEFNNTNKNTEENTNDKIINNTDKSINENNTESSENNTESSENIENIEEPLETVIGDSDIEVTVIGDKRCIECQTAPITSQLKTIPALSNASFIIKDFSDEGVKDIIKNKGITVLPAFIFNKNTIDPGLDQFLIKLNDESYNLNVGATFDPYAEICDNGIDDTGNGQIDCADTTCASKMVCRTEIKNKLDVFLMGYCPFGEIAAKAIPDLQKTFGDDLTIDLHYIASKTGQGDEAKDFQSLHGTPEAEEDIRQLCITKYYDTNKTISYMQTRYANSDNYGRVTDEPNLAYKANGIDADKINNCITNGEGAKLLEDDIKLAQDLGIGASPTWLANNRYQFGGIKAASIQAEFCKYNPDLKGCQNKIETTTPANSGQPSCNN